MATGMGRGVCGDCAGKSAAKAASSISSRLEGVTPLEPVEI